MTRYLSACLLCGLAFAAGAQNVAAQDASRNPSPAATGQAEGASFEDANQHAQDRSPLSDRNCLRETGSRIVARANRQADELKDPTRRRCVSMSGRSYDRDDLDRTGQTDVADALRMLDPSVH